METPRLRLRRPTREDAGILSQLWRDEQVQQFMGGVLSPQEAQGRMAGILCEWEETQTGLWAVCERTQDNLIGLCGLGAFESEAEVVYKLFPAFWGHGYATEAARASLAYGFHTLQLERILGVTQEANQRSQRVLEKLGMRYRESLWKWEAAQRVYELTRTEWLAEDDQLVGL